MNGLRLGNYELVAKLGQGGMAAVYEARAIAGRLVGRRLAVKRLLPALEGDVEARRLFQSESELSLHLHHPHIVEVLDVGSDLNAIFMVMEMIDGRDAGQIIRQCRKRKVYWPIDFAVYTTVVLLDALSYAHQAASPAGRALQVVHCDVSPSNFFVSRTGDLKLGDFGVARSTIEAGARDIAGKPYYLSPEALRGEVTIQVDLWAVAVTLYELLTLERPFRGSSPEAVFAAIRNNQYEPVRKRRGDVSESLEVIIQRALSPDVTERFGHAGDFLDALRAHYDERVGTSLAISAMVRGLF